jgi:methionyl aminopeptidase
VAQVLTELQGLADVGVNLLDLEHHVRRRIDERGAESCYWDYAPSFGSGPFRNVICLSVNDAVLHGLPHDYRLRDGDVLGMDLAVGIDGWVADSAITVIVGTAAEDDGRLVRATQVALEAAIEAAQPGNRLGDVSAATGSSSTRTAGRSARPTAHTRRTPNTRSRSPRTARSCSPGGPTSGLPRTREPERADHPGP